MWCEFYVWPWILIWIFSCYFSCVYTLYVRLNQNVYNKTVGLVREKKNEQGMDCPHLWVNLNIICYAWRILEMHTWPLLLESSKIFHSISVFTFEFFDATLSALTFIEYEKKSWKSRSFAYLLQNFGSLI